MRANVKARWKRLAWTLVCLTSLVLGFNLGQESSEISRLRYDLVRSWTLWQLEQSGETNRVYEERALFLFTCCMQYEQYRQRWVYWLLPTQRHNEEEVAAAYREAVHALAALWEEEYGLHLQRGVSLTPDSGSEEK